MDTVPVAKKSDLDGKRFKTVSLLGKKVAIFREEDGSYYAIEVSCKHHGADLTAGELNGDVVTCPRHGWKFDIKTGECLTNPTSPPLRRHALELDGETIRVSLTPESNG